MDATFYHPRFRIFLVNISQAGNIYDNTSPTEEGLVTYSIVTPIICAFGILGNTISLIVLNRRELKGSVYVYLAVMYGMIKKMLDRKKPQSLDCWIAAAILFYYIVAQSKILLTIWYLVLAFVDLCSSVLLFLSGLSCGIFFTNSNWPVYDVLFGVPLSILFNTMGVLTAVMVTFDRICYLANPLRRRKPKFCHAYMARRIMVIAFILSAITTVPYCFAFTYVNDEVIPRKFYFSKFYSVYSWLRLVVFGVIPSIYLILGNGYLIYALRNLKKMYGKCNSSFKCKKPENYTNLTTTLILIVFIFVISQIPSILVNRATASTFFFSSVANTTDSCNSKFLENFREISTVLNAISLSSDFILYYLFCPPFCKVLAKMCRRKKKCKTVQMNVFVIDKEICFDNNGKSMSKLTTGKLFQMVDTENNRDSCPSSIYDGSCSRSEEEAVKSNRDTLMTLCPDNIG